MYAHICSRVLNTEEGREDLSGQIFKSELDLLLKDIIAIKMKKYIN